MNNDKGFTLVEVIAAMAVVAIVSTSLFQMFVTSSYVNKEAQIMDVANIIAVGQAEEFKSNPLRLVGLSPELSYYDGKGNGLSVPALGGVPSGSAFVVESQLQVIDSLANNAAYYPDFAGILDLSFFTDCDVEITNTYEIKAKPHGAFGPISTLYNQGDLKIKHKVLPLRVNFPSGGTLNTIYLTNDSDVEAELYVFNANSSEVILNPVQGSSSIAYVSVASSNNTEYDLTLIVSRLNKGVSEEMFRYSANRFLYTN